MAIIIWIIMFKKNEMILERIRHSSEIYCDSVSYKYVQTYT
jgi:hypothetical protein